LTQYKFEMKVKTI